MIRAEALEFRYGNKPPIFQDFHWYAARGQAWAVIGASGCGKSTLLYLLAGLLKPTAGRVMVGGQPLAGPRPRTGLILQDYGLLPWATIRENVRLGLRIRRFYGPDGIHAPAEGLPAGAEEQVEAWLEKLGISSVANSYPGQVSGGQRQRTAIARTLVLEPDLLLMDEPFASLDLPTREGLQALVYELQQERDLTMVVVTHSIEEAAFLGEKIMILQNRVNSAPEVLENPFVAQKNSGVDPAYQQMCDHIRAELKETV